MSYLDSERTPNLPSATGSLLGMTRRSLSPAHFAQAAVESMLCGLVDAVDAIRAVGVTPDARLVAAIVDRVTFNTHIMETGTQSYRLATSKTASRASSTHPFFWLPYLR
jgi:hypothetical protein